MSIHVYSLLLLLLISCKVNAVTAIVSASVVKLSSHNRVSCYTLLACSKRLESLWCEIICLLRVWPTVLANCTALLLEYECAI
jgi:hypothetical protein